MKTLVLFIFFPYVLTGQIFLQKNLISSGGGVSETGGNRIQLSIGQVASGLSFDEITNASIGFWYTETVTPLPKPSVTVLKRFDGNLILYPNPATKIVFIEYTLPVKKMHVITVSDIKGKKVKEIKITDAIDFNSYLLNLDEFTAGQYIIQVLLDQVIQSKKLIVL